MAPNAAFVRCTEEGTWARVDTQGARALGLWATTSVSDPQEIVMLTGYDGPAHWEETRNAGPISENFDPDLWGKAVQLATRRGELIIKSWVCLMRTIQVRCRSEKVWGALS